MKQLFLFIGILFVSFSQIEAAEKEGQIYRWVDDKGVVHFADKAKNKTAVLVDVKETTTNSLIESNIELPEIKTKSEKVKNKVVLSEEDQQYCDYIREQIRLAKEAIEMGNELRVNYAGAYLKTSDKLLKDNRCI